MSKQEQAAGKALGNLIGRCIAAVLIGFLMTCGVSLALSWVGLPADFVRQTGENLGAGVTQGVRNSINQAAETAAKAKADADALALDQWYDNYRKGVPSESK